MKKYIVVKTGVDVEEHLTKISEITDEQIELIRPVVLAIKEFKPDPSNMEEGALGSFTCNFCFGEECRQYSEEKTADDLYGHLSGYEMFKTFIPEVVKESRNILSVEIFTVQEVVTLF